MDHIVEDMCKQRLRLPRDTDIDSIRSGHISSTFCEAGNSHHIAFIGWGRGHRFKGA